MDHVSEKRFPVNSKDYKLYEEIGEGVSATVYRALCVPLNEVVAIKVLDLEKCNNDLDGIRREVQTMILIDHPNLLRAHCSFTAGHNLWVVMPYMAGGSCLHIMKTSYPEGFEEPVIATLLHEVLKALVYLHFHGHIHRDVKAGNILVDANGSVKLADFGVSACMFDTGDRQRTRNTFVGTPCWMAPEVMQQLHGYDFKADIWSFGITALELAHGHAPFSKYPPMKVLLMTLQNAPPGLDYERDKRFSKSFKEMIAACLVKDPKKRPTSEKLCKHHFFKHARSSEYLTQTILEGLSPLGDRFRTLKDKEADFLLQNKVMYGNKEQLSQQEYIRGISGWNFNLDDLKTQAALIQDGDEISNSADLDMNSKSKDEYDDATTAHENELHERRHAEASLASSFPICPLHALKGYFDVCEDDVNASSPNWTDAVKLNSEQKFQLQPSPQEDDQEMKNNDGDNLERSISFPRHTIALPGNNDRFLSGSLLPEHALSPSQKISGDGDRENLLKKYQGERNYSGPLSYIRKRDVNSQTSANIGGVEDSLEETIVQRRGRFKVTSGDLSPKGVPSANCIVNPVSGVSTSPTILAASILPSLQYILQQNAMQREQIIRLIKSVEQTSGNNVELAVNDQSLLSPATSRERELQSQVVHLQQSIGSLVEELQRVKIKNAQLERHLNALFNMEEEKRIRKENEERG